MWNPVGNLPKEVYWRRRALIGAVAVLVVITLVVLFLATRSSGSGSGTSGAVGSSPTDSASAVPSDSPTADPSSSTASSGTSSPSGSGSVSGSGSASASAGTSSSDPAVTGTPSASSPSANAVPAACTAASLKIAASTSLPSYPVGASPGLNMVVTNVGAQPCVADLSDGNIVLLVYFGDARIWGSHDCSIEPGASPQTLPANEPVTRQIVWTGLSSNEGCTATRQRVGAGTYTLQPVFAGQNGSPVTFTMV